MKYKVTYVYREGDGLHYSVPTDRGSIEVEVGPDDTLSHVAIDAVYAQEDPERPVSHVRITGAKPIVTGESMTNKEARAKQCCNGCGAPGADLCRIEDGRHVAVCRWCWQGYWGGYVVTKHPVDVPWEDFCEADGTMIQTDKE